MACVEDFQEVSKTTPKRWRDDWNRIALEWNILEDIDQELRTQSANQFLVEDISEPIKQSIEVENIDESFDSPPLEKTSQHSALKNRFDQLLYDWHQETCGLSSITKKITNLNYLKIIAMGEAAVPLILDALAAKPDHWFIALKALTDHDPTNPGDNFEQAVAAWLHWGRQNGLMS